MVLCKQILFLKFISTPLKSGLTFKHMHISSVLQESVTQYRLRKGIPAKGREYGPLADLPDWSYADGRPAPIPHEKAARIKLQKEYLDQIINLSKEVDKCLDLNRQKAVKEEDIRRKAKANFLKSKGQAFS